MTSRRRRTCISPQKTV